MYKEIAAPILAHLDSEAWHTYAREALHLAEISPFTLKLVELFADRHKRFKDERLKVVLGGIELENPVMVGAGWDKDGRAVSALYHLGFSGVEVGTVTRLPQPGNAKPRQFLVGPGVILNNLGFNNEGMDVVSQNLEKYSESGVRIGVSLGKNKEVGLEKAPRDYAAVAEKLYKHASYFAINVSSPNTPNLRELQKRGPLIDIIQAVQNSMDVLGGLKPLFVKIAPDLTTSELDEVIRVVIDNRLTGIIAANTTNNYEIKKKYGIAHKPGGISGADTEYRKMVNDKISHIYRETGGKLEIIGVGGINNTETAWEKIRAGARVIQIVTAIRTEGPAVAGKINRGLVAKMDSEGIKTISELIGLGT